MRGGVTGARQVEAKSVRYPEQLLAVIDAPDAAAKDVLLARISPPPMGLTWTPPEVPYRPGRTANYREVANPARRRRGLLHKHTRLRFLHSIHHIELTAIDLAVLLCLRAPGAPPELHRDFLAIAREEAEHSQLLGELLTREGFPPGSDPVHHRLWDSARAATNLGEQLVVVPRFLEARGLDVSAELLPRLIDIDAASHAVILRIYTDEIRHVATGTRWHGWWCKQQNTTVDAHFAATVEQHFGTQVPGPFVLDHDGRTKAGFSPAELELLKHPPWDATPKGFRD